MLLNVKKIFIFVICTLQIPQPVFARSVLTVCSELSFLPLSLKTKTGRPSGFEIDILKEYAREKNLHLNFHEVKWTDSIPALLLKKCDLIASGMSPTPERIKLVDFSVPYYVIIDQFVVKKNNSAAKDFSTLPEFNRNGIKISVRQGNEVAIYLKEHFKQVEILEFPNSDADVIDALLNGRVDVAALHSSTASMLVAQHKEQLFVFPTAIPTGNFLISYALRKSNIDLKNNINDFLNRFKSTQDFQNLYNKYFTNTEFLRE